MSLTKYQEKRHFDVTPEPSGKISEPAKVGKPLLYVIQKHRATSLHYDFRLEWKGTLLSWAVPKGPSLDPSVKWLAMQVEDHPIDYAGFEGVIPEGEYGGGTVMVWDTGTWTPEIPDVDAALDKGDLKFAVNGKKLRGSWVLVRTRGWGANPSRSSWLLIKHRDEFATTADITEDEPYSVISRGLLADIARAGGGDVVKAATGDPGGQAGDGRQAKTKAGREKKPGKLVPTGAKTTRPTTPAKTGKKMSAPAQKEQRTADAARAQTGAATKATLRKSARKASGLPPTKRKRG